MAGGTASIGHYARIGPYNDWARRMKLKCQLDIDADRETVWAAFDNPDYRRRWQPGLRRVEHLSGEQGQPGAVVKYTFDDGSRNPEMTERVTERRQPDFIATQSRDSHASTTTVNHFERLSADRTRWVVYANYTSRGFLRFVAPLFKRSILRGIEESMQRFKLMVESDLEGDSG